MFTGGSPSFALPNFIAAARNRLKLHRLVPLRVWVRGHKSNCSAHSGRDVAWWAVALAAGVCVKSPAHAQAILPLAPPPLPPWSAQEVFQPVPYAELWSRTPGQSIAPEDTPVKTRQRPGYDPVGIRFHSWMFYPQVTAGAFYNSNVFASNINKQSDFIGEFQPSIKATSLWDRHQLNFDAYSRSLEYSRFSGLDQTDASVRMSGRIDVRHDIAILFKLRAAYLHEEVGSLSSPTGAIQPTPYGYTFEDVTYWQQFNRLAVSFGARNENYNFGSTRAQNGAVINQDSRDGSINVGHARVDYAISPNIGLFTAFEGNERNLRGTPTSSLSSTGYHALSGVNFRLTSLIGGEVGAGYTSQRFDDPRIGTVAGPAYRALITWSPTRSLDIKLKGEEITTEAVDTITSAVRASAIQLGADYELRRNLIFSMSAAYEHDKFFGQVREDNVYAVNAGLDYLLNRISSVGLRYKFVRRNSNLPTSTYDRHEIGIDVTAHF